MADVVETSPEILADRLDRDIVRLIQDASHAPEFDYVGVEQNLQEAGYSFRHVVSTEFDSGMTTTTHELDVNFVTGQTDSGRQGVLHISEPWGDSEQDDGHRRFFRLNFHEGSRWLNNTTPDSGEGSQLNNAEGTVFFPHDSQERQQATLTHEDVEFIREARNFINKILGDKLDK